MLNIEIPPSAPVTKEEREKWLEKAEYGGKTRRLIDHIERMEKIERTAYCDWCGQEIAVCSGTRGDASREQSIAFLDKIREHEMTCPMSPVVLRAKQAEAERDALKALLQKDYANFCAKNIGKPICEEAKSFILKGTCYADITEQIAFCKRCFIEGAREEEGEKE